MRTVQVELRFSEDETEQLRLAASLKHMTVAEYVRRAINAQLRKEGVDAVLMKEAGD